MAKTYNSIEEFNVALQSAFDGLTAEIGKVIKPLSSDLANNIKVRVQSTGVRSRYPGIPGIPVSSFFGFRLQGFNFFSA